MFVASRVSLCLLILLLSGCGSKLQKAGGKVLVDGQPVKDGSIMFYPTQGGRPAMARLMPDGAFTLSFAKPGDGLPVGDYKVVIVADIWIESKTKSKAQEYDEAVMKKLGIEDQGSIAASGQLIHIVPPEYNDISTTPLKQSVARTSAPQDFVYDIPSKGKK